MTRNIPYNVERHFAGKRLHKGCTFVCYTHFTLYYNDITEETLKFGWRPPKLPPEESSAQLKAVSRVVVSTMSDGSVVSTVSMSNTDDSERAADATQEAQLVIDMSTLRLGSVPDNQRGVAAGKIRNLFGVRWFWKHIYNVMIMNGQ